jgi:hypothetical protein
LAEYTIFGPSARTGFVAASDGAAAGGINLGMAFKVTGITGWRAVGVKVFVPAGTPAAGVGPQGAWSAYLFTTSPGTGGKPQPATLTRSVDFSPVPVRGQWNEVRFVSPLALTPDTVYWASVFCSDGTYGTQPGVDFATERTSIESTNLRAPAASTVLPGNGSYAYASKGSLPNEGAGTWYGLDVIVDDDGNLAAAFGDTITITDAVTATRGGLPTTVTATATVTDPLGLASTDIEAMPIGGPTGIATVTRQLLDTRIVWGSVIDQGGAAGPSFAVEPTAVTPGVCFHVRFNCQIAGGRIYKPPALTGTVPICLWAQDGTKLAETSLTGLVADTGGWRDWTFPAPVDVTPAGGQYTVSFFSAGGQFSFSQWIWHGQDYVNPPFHVPMFRENTQGRFDGAAYGTGATHVMPANHTATNYYIDVRAQWTVSTPRYPGGTGYYDQWVNGPSQFAFPVGVFFADPEFLAGYMGLGVNTLVGGGMDDTYSAAVRSSGIDWWPTLDLPSVVTATIAGVLEDVALATHIRGYFLGDEPDLINLDPVGFRTPQYFKDLRAAIRRMDSTRMTMINLGRLPPYNMGFVNLPAGGIVEANDIWRGYSDAADLLSIDWYNMTTDQAFGLFGIWTYPVITQRAVELSDGRIPAWGYVETTAQVPNEPTPTQVYRASWAHLIAGAQGIVFFDHRFADADVTQDFAAMLHNPAMSARVESLAAQLQTLAPVLHAAEADLVTTVSSSGAMAAPLGGYAAGAKIPIHYATRLTGGRGYLFAQAIRPGATTGTFTVPSAADQTLTVIDEGRTVTADSAGVFTDSFPADYGVHLYSWPAAGGGDGGGGASALADLHDPAFVGPAYYDQWSKGPSSSLGYFPILAYHMNLAQWSGLAARLVACNITGILMAYDQSADYIINVAVANGLEIVGIGSEAQWHEDPANNIDAVYPTQQSIISSYSMSDEPNQGGSVYALDQGTPADDAGAELYIEDANAQKAADPNRPIMGNWTKDLNEWNNGYGPPGWGEADVEEHHRRMMAAIDIGSFDAYAWIDENEWYMDDPGFGTRHVGSWIYGHLIDRIQYFNPDVPAYGFLECTRSGDGVNTIMPGMIKSGAWMMVAHGARGFCYWPRDFHGTDVVLYAGADEFITEFSVFADHQWDTNYAAMQQVNGEILSHAVAINSPTITGCSATGTGGVPITVLGKDVGGKLWMLVMADGSETHPMGNQTPMTGTITVPSVIAPGTVLNVVGESRTVTVGAGHTFTDTFGTTTETPWPLIRPIPPLTYGYAHHIYEEA